MSNENMKHNDCVNFSPVDVAKGICRLSNQTVFIDALVCEKFNEVSKCKNCSSFKNPNKDNMGTCVGLKKPSWTYGELNAVTCEGYKANK
jgi:4-hydroxyphenylacetate decarboxylase small subunit